MIALELRGSRGKRAEIEALIDTGYDGRLTLPRDLIERLGLKWQRYGQATLADDRDITFDVYAGQILWDRRWRSIPIDHSESILLVGMRLLERYELTIQVITGGQATVTTLPDQTA